MGVVKRPLPFLIGEGVKFQTGVSSLRRTLKIEYTGTKDVSSDDSPKVGTPRPRRSKYRCYRFRVNTKTYTLHCFSSSQKVLRLFGSPKTSEQEPPTWNSDCYRDGKDSQNDNDTSLRSWRRTRQRWNPYDTVSQTVTLVLPVKSEMLSAGVVENKYCGQIHSRFYGRDAKLYLALLRSLQKTPWNTTWLPERKTISLI